MQNEIVKVEGTVATAITRYAEIAEAIKSMEAEQKALKAYLNTAHGNAEATTLLTEEGHRSAVIGATIRVGVDADRLAKEQPLKELHHPRKGLANLGFVFSFNIEICQIDQSLVRRVP